MNEHLFRAYDKGRKQYLSAGHLFVAINSSPRPNKSEIYLDIISNPDEYKDRFIIEQYIGLPDKNKKKIFENDIIKFGNTIGYINFNKGCFCVKLNKPDWSNRNNPAIDIILNEYPNDIEIIGNIHDNLELLDCNFD